MKKICAGESAYQLSEAQIKSLQEIDLNILYSVTSRYCFLRFNMVVEFYQEHHHLDIPLDMVCADGKNLSVWVRAQRYRYREGKLSQLYLDAIRKHGLMEMLEKPLDVTIRHIEEYYREHGNVDIENAYVSPDGFPLGDRVRALRDKHVNSRNKSAYPQEAIDHLNEMGMIWNKNDYIWQQNYKTCKAYLEESGGYILPYEMLTESGTSMRTWVLSNRRALMQGKQPAERAELLESIHISEIDFTEPLQKLVRKYTGVSIERDRIWMENYQKCNTNPLNSSRQSLLEFSRRRRRRGLHETCFVQQSCTKQRVTKSAAP